MGTTLQGRARGSGLSGLGQVEELSLGRGPGARRADERLQGVLAGFPPHSAQEGWEGLVQNSKNVSSSWKGPVSGLLV